MGGIPATVKYVSVIEYLQIYSKTSAAYFNSRWVSF